MKKNIAALTAAVMLLSVFTGCGKKDADAAPAETAGETVTEAVTEPPIDKGEMHGLSAKELVAQMGTGWNLGNSLDSVGNDETAWGNPATTKEMIDAVHAQGFDILRVPVTWFSHMGQEPDYKIEDEFMARVTEVVDYGIANGMFVILDTHHEPDSWLIPKDKKMPVAEAKLAAVWKQIAENFKDYGDHLVFEGINEARVKNTPEEWSGGTEEGRANVNKFNRIFFDTVRATGGNNAERLLIIAPYAHCSDRKAMADLDLDYDDHTAAAVHAYTPYSFTYHNLQSYETFTWDGHENSAIDWVFKEINDCIVSKGMPVIITEYGAETKQLEDGTYNTADVCAWATYYLETAKSYGIPCVWWDNNYYFDGNEHFGIFNRNLCKWYTPEVADTITGLYK